VPPLDIDAGGIGVPGRHRPDARGPRLARRRCRRQGFTGILQFSDIIAAQNSPHAHG